MYLLGDHLGSTALTADGASGAKLSELRCVWGGLCKRTAWFRWRARGRWCGIGMRTQIITR